MTTVMKRYGLVLLGSLLGCLMLVGCVSQQPVYSTSQMMHENWMRAVEMNTTHWARGADRWFLTGKPNATELANRRAAYHTAMSTMMVKVTAFNKIKVNGDFQVQLFGARDKNSVFVYGANAALRGMMVQVRGDTLYVYQDPKAPRRMMKRVIVRIGVVHLAKLTQQGPGLIEGINLNTRDLSILSTGSGPIYLSGDVWLARVMSQSCGNITIFGALSNRLDILSMASGRINIAGSHVGIRSLVHRGTGDVNIIGANSNPDCAMVIDTDGAGKIGLSGYANIGRIVARKNTCVYVCGAVSQQTAVLAIEHARVGLAGVGHGLAVHTMGQAMFYGRYFCVASAQVNAQNRSHINVSALSRLMAVTTQSASIYYFEKPDFLSEFTYDNSVILPFWAYGYHSCKRIVGYKGEG